MPPDPTPLTDAEIQEVEHAREYATAPYSQISNTDSRHEETRDRCIVWRLDDAGNDFATFTGENASTNAVFYILAHKHLPALLAAFRENAGLREEVAALVPLLAGERAHTSQLTCRHIACHNTLMSPGVHTGETTDVVLIGIRRLQETVATLTAERDAALARVAELERYVEQLREPLLQEATDLGQEIESAPPPPDPKWVRCPAGCDNGSANSEPCEGCISSGRPGWVKETPQ